MRIAAKCRRHPESAVLILIGTVRLQTSGSLQYVSEQSERAELIELDEANLYCTDDRTDHDLFFEVLQ